MNMLMRDVGCVMCSQFFEIVAIGFARSFAHIDVCLFQQFNNGRAAQVVSSILDTKNIWRAVLIDLRGERLNNQW